MHRPWRVLAAFAVLVMTVTACQKPLPELTVLSGSTTTTVQPQTYCFDPSHCHFPKSVVGEVSAQSGSTLLVDVPRAVAAQTWSVVSAVRNAKGDFKTIKGANYRANAVTNSHSTRIDVPYGVGSYYLIVSQRGTATLGSWVAEITIHQ
jgi:hypothetical protein